MNTFYEYEDIFDRAEAVRLNQSFAEFLDLASGIRCKLGKQAYLLDEYIALLLEGANATLLYSAAEDGFAASAELRNLCLDIMDGKTDCAGHPLYERFEEYIAAHLLPYQERVTKLSLYCVALAGDYLDYAAGKYRQEQKDILQKTLDIIHLRELYQTLAAFLGGEGELERLNLLIRQRFLFVTPMEAFMQGWTNDLLYSLTSRDMETSRLVFQLWNVDL